MCILSCGGFGRYGRDLRNIAREIAYEAGIWLSQVQLEDGMALGCRDSYLLTMMARGKTVSARFQRTEIEQFPELAERCRERINVAIDRLQGLLQECVADGVSL